jgi:hypothetical protein
MLSVGVVAGCVAFWRHAEAEAGVRRAVAALAEEGATPDLAAAVGAVDAEYPLLWAGVVRPDEHGTLRAVESWTSSATPASTDALVEGALRRLGGQPAAEGGRGPSAGGRPMTLVPQRDGWTVLIPTGGPIPDAVLRALSTARAGADESDGSRHLTPVPSPPLKVAA